jgi:hypothetical protein
MLFSWNSLQQTLLQALLLVTGQPFLAAPSIKPVEHCHLRRMVSLLSLYVQTPAVFDDLANIVQGSKFFSVDHFATGRIHSTVSKRPTVRTVLLPTLQYSPVYPGFL